MQKGTLKKKNSELKNNEIHSKFCKRSTKETQQFTTRKTKLVFFYKNFINSKLNGENLVTDVCQL